MGECMTQEDAENMSNEQAVNILIPLRDMMRDQNGCPISDAYFALDKAVDALRVKPLRKMGKWVPLIESDYYETKENGLTQWHYSKRAGKQTLIRGRKIFTCSACRTAMTQVQDDDGKCVLTAVTRPVPFCPWCGAQMGEQWGRGTT